MAEKEAPINEVEEFFENYGREQEPEEPQEPVAEETEAPQETVEPVEGEEPTEPEGAKEPVEPEQPAELTAEKQIEIFNQLTGLKAGSLDEIQEYSGVLSKWPDYKKNIELYPTLIEKLKTTQDVMSYFPDEATYKLAQLSKDEKYKGREAELTKVLKSDVSQMPEMDVVKLYAGVNSPAGVKNPFRYTIKKMGLDPDEVIDNFAELSEDDKDLFNGFAAQARQELSAIGNDIEVPKSSIDDIEVLLKQQSDQSRDDLEKRKTEVMPIASSVVDEIKEFPVADDFSFKLALNDKEKREYSEFLTEAVLSGDFNVSTDEGKRDLYNALLDEIWVDSRDKILKAYDTHLRTKLEKEFDEKYNNATPLKKDTPPPKDQKTKSSQMVDVVNDMINELL